MTAIFDYGAGNLRSVENALDHIGAAYEVVRDSAALKRGSKIILPGVGHFGQMMRALDQLGVRETLRQQLRSGVPFLGICLGLQALFERSAEAPEVEGLGLFPGTIERFPQEARVPHMGWSDITISRPSRWFPDPMPSRYVYFAHSYFLPVTEGTLATCCYGAPFTAAFASGHIFGVQFHPEKSGPLGLALIRRFIQF